MKDSHKAGGSPNDRKNSRMRLQKPAISQGCSYSSNTVSINAEDAAAISRNAVLLYRHVVHTIITDLYTMGTAKILTKKGRDTENFLLNGEKATNDEGEVTDFSRSLGTLFDKIQDVDKYKGYYDFFCNWNVMRQSDSGNADSLKVLPHFAMMVTIECLRCIKSKEYASPNTYLPLISEKLPKWVRLKKNSYTLLNYLLFEEHHPNRTIGHTRRKAIIDQSVRLVKSMKKSPLFSAITDDVLTGCLDNDTGLFSPIAVRNRLPFIIAAGLVADAASENPEIANNLANIVAQQAERARD